VHNVDSTKVSRSASGRRMRATTGDDGCACGRKFFKHMAGVVGGARLAENVAFQR